MYDTSNGSVSVFQVRESEDFYNLSKDKLLELILSDELEIEDEQVSDQVSFHKNLYYLQFSTFLSFIVLVDDINENFSQRVSFVSLQHLCMYSTKVWTHSFNHSVFIQYFYYFLHCRNIKRQCQHTVNSCIQLYI